MSLIGIFVRYIFTFGILPLFIIYLIGWPIFIIRILNKVLYIKINDVYVFNFLIVLFALLDIYYYWSYSTGNKIINTIIKNEIINTEEYSVKLSQMHSDERNIYIFLTCIAMLLSIHKFGERILRIDNMEKEKKEKEKQLGIDKKDNSEHKKNEYIYLNKIFFKFIIK